jgi:methylmalonyl-CoA/ethylmalonyl-CoA epimerase
MAPSRAPDAQWLPTAKSAYQAQQSEVGGIAAMKFKRVEHIAIAINDMNAVKRMFEEKLGLSLEYEEHLEEHHTKLAMYPVGETYLELLEGTAPSSITSKWIAERGEGLFHICLEVEDIRGALAELKSKGVKLLDEEPRPGHGGSLVAFLNPESTASLVIELTQAGAPH